MVGRAMSATTTNNRILLCTECDVARFPRERGEGYVDLGEWRDRLFRQFTTPRDRLMAIITSADEPDVRVWLDGEEIPSKEVMELYAGCPGWVVLFGSDDSVCPRCDEEVTVAVQYGNVEFTAVVQP
jgi:hypothetical protein